MKYKTRLYYSEEQKSLMWDRWQKGESLHPIARLFNITPLSSECKSPVSVQD